MFNWTVAVGSRPIVAALTFLGMACIYRATQRTVTLIVDGQVQEIHTHARVVRAVLYDAGIHPGSSDRILPDLSQTVRSGAIIQFDRAYPIVLDFDGELKTVSTPVSSPANILAENGILLYPGDRLWVDGLLLNDLDQRLSSRPVYLRIRKAVPLTLEIDGARRTFRSAAPTLGEALWEMGVRLYEADELEPPADTAILGPLRVRLRSSRPVHILGDGGQVETRVVAEDVRGALAQAGMAPVGLDYAVPDLDEPIPPDRVIRVVRVAEQIQVELRPLAFETQYQPIADLEIDNQRVLEVGAYGVLANRVRIRLEDGKETGRQVEGEWLVQEPKPQVVGYGSKIVVRSMNSPHGRIEYWRAITMYATSYSPSRAGVSPSSPNFGITASGKPLTKGLVAIDRRYIPFGTRMYVPGYGFAEAADTGGGVKGRWIDLGYDDDNYVGWHQNVTVYFLTPVPPAGSIAWIFP